MRSALASACWLGIGLLCATGVPVAEAAGLQLLSGPVRTPVSRDPTYPAPPPVYPQDAYAQRHEGKVVLLMEIDAAGRMVQSRVERSSGYRELDLAALAAVRQWHFRPAHLGSLPEAGYARVPIEFNLPERPAQATAEELARGWKMGCPQPDGSMQEGRSDGPGCVVLESLAGPISRPLHPGKPHAWRRVMQTLAADVDIDEMGAVRDGPLLTAWLKRSYRQPQPGKDGLPITGEITRGTYNCSSRVFNHGMTWRYGVGHQPVELQPSGPWNEMIDAALGQAFAAICRG